MGFALNGDIEIVVQRGKDCVVRGLAIFGAPVLKRDNGARQGLGDDLVFDRAKQHLANGRDEGNEDKDQQRRDQCKGAQFFAAKGAREALFQRDTIGGNHRPVCHLACGGLIGAWSGIHIIGHWQMVPVWSRYSQRFKRLA
jgi:hypothetical protein